MRVPRERDEVRRLLAARRAPRGEEREDDDASAQRASDTWSPERVSATTRGASVPTMRRVDRRRALLDGPRRKEAEPAREQGERYEGGEPNA